MIQNNDISSDFGLVERILSGEDRALWEFYKIYKRKLSSYINNKIGNQRDAEEVLQDILLAGVSALRDYSGKARLSTFIFSIARNKIVDYYRKKKIKQVIFSTLPELGNLLSTLASPEEQLDKKLNKERISGVLRRLKPGYQKVIAMKYIQGMTMKEIARRLNQTIKTVESRLFRARKAFVEIYSFE